MKRQRYDLSGLWLFRPDHENQGETEGWFNDLDDHADWREVCVPTAFDNCGPDMDRYTGIGWFRTSFRTQEDHTDRRADLHFEGVNYNTRVWVNGVQVADNHDAFLPFQARIDKFLRPAGEVNTLVVRVDNLRTRGQFPLFEGWFGQGGILREVFVETSDFLRIERFALRGESGYEQGMLNIEMDFSNCREKRLKVMVETRILNTRGDEIETFGSEFMTLRPDEEAGLETYGEVPGIALWSPDNPVLYTVEATLYDKHDVLIDQVASRVGFREIEVRNGRILLNGEPVRLLGFNRHEDSPRSGMAVDLEQARADFEDMKAMGANFVRLCHYPHHPGELDLCDEIGLLVMAENAMNEWGHVDHPDPGGGFELSPEDAPMIVENGRRTLEKMVLRHGNHPSIIIWSVGNESAEERPDVVEGNAALIEYGRSLDPSRPWTHVSNSFGKPEYSPGFYRADDVISVNVYPTHNCPHDEAAVQAGLPESTRYMRSILERIHNDWPGKPILVTEFGYPMSEDEDEQAVALQAAAVKAEFQGLDTPWVAGGAYWCYAHHPWPGNACYSGGLTESPYGYVTRDRKRRHPAMDVIRRLFQKDSQDRVK